MQRINIELQLAGFYEHILTDPKLKKPHITIYFALTMKWRLQKENPVITFTAKELMASSDIGSRNAYFRYLQELVKWGYIAEYSGASNGAYTVMKPLYPQGSHTTSTICDTPVSDLKNNISEIDKKEESDSIIETESANKTKPADTRTEDPTSYHQIPNAPSFDEVKNMYITQRLTTADAMKFYSYYSRKNWKTKNGDPIHDWKALVQVAIYRLLNKKRPPNNDNATSKYEELL